jgi:hypothetical protein
MTASHLLGRRRGDHEARGGGVRKERRERRPSPVTGLGPDLSPSVARHHNLRLSLFVLRLLGVAPGRQPNMALQGRITASFFELDHMPVQFLSLPCAFIAFFTCSTSSMSSRAPSSRTLLASEAAAHPSSGASRCALTARSRRHNDPHVRSTALMHTRARLLSRPGILASRFALRYGSRILRRFAPDNPVNCSVSIWATSAIMDKQRQFHE